MPGLGNKLGLNRIDPVVDSGGYSSLVNAVLTRSSAIGATNPTAATLGHLDTLLTGLQSDGIWALCDLVYVFATDGDAAFAKINVKNPGTYDCLDIATPLFTSKLGFDANGGSNGLSTQWNPSTNGVNFQLNGASISAWLPQTATADGNNQRAMGCSDGNDVFMTPVNSGGSHRYRLNQSSASVMTSAQAIGTTTINRANSTNVQGYINGVLDDSENDASSAIPNEVLYICGQNSGAGFADPYDGNISIVLVGGDMTGLFASMHSRLNTYMSSI